MTPKDRMALSAYMEMLDDTVDLRNDSIAMNGGDPVRLLLADRDEIEADRDRLRSELDAARAELARVRRQLLRRMGDAAVEKAKSLEVALNKERERRGRKWPSDVIRAFRRLNRMHGAVEAILRAEELARMGEP